MHWTLIWELMVQSLVSFSLHVVTLDKKLYSMLSLFTQVYKWALAIIMLPTWSISFMINTHSC